MWQIMIEKQWNWQNHTNVARKYLLRKKVNVDRCETKSQQNALCDLESLQFRRQVSALVTLIKLIHISPEHLQHFHLSLSSSPRRPNKININYHGVRFSSLFSNKAAMLWNCLPPSLTAITSLSEFKHSLYQHFHRYIHYTDGIPTP